MIPAPVPPLAAAGFGGFAEYDPGVVNATPVAPNAERSKVAPLPAPPVTETGFAGLTLYEPGLPTLTPPTRYPRSKVAPVPPPVTPTAFAGLTVYEPAALTDAAFTP